MLGNVVNEKVLLKHIVPAIYPQLVERDKYGPYNIRKILIRKINFDIDKLYYLGFVLDCEFEIQK